MIINAPNLAALRVGFSTAFKNGLGRGVSQFGLVATTVSAGTGAAARGFGVFVSRRSRKPR